MLQEETKQYDHNQIYILMLLLLVENNSYLNINKKNLEDWQDFYIYI